MHHKKEKESPEYLKHQSVEVGPVNPVGETRIRRAIDYKDRELLKFERPGIETMYDTLVWTVNNYPDNKMLGTRSRDGEKHYEWITYKQFFERMKKVAMALISLGLKPREDKFGIYSKTRMEWLLFSEAANCLSMPTVAVYDTFGFDVATYVINHAELPILVSSEDMLLKLMPHISKETCKDLKFIIQIEDATENQKKYIQERGFQLYSLSELEKMGSEKEFQPHPPKASDVAVLMYTSGTTGTPKGVLLTHQNILSANAGVKERISSGCRITRDDVYMAYLPLAHVLERQVELAVISEGAAIGYYSGDPKNLSDDINALCPTIFVGVPRIFDRIHQNVQHTIEHAGFLTRFIFRTAYNTKSGNFHHMDTFTEAQQSTMVYNKLVFDKIKQKMGGKLRGILTAAAPISEPVHEFMEICFEIPVTQGYGLTETSAGGCVSYPDDIRKGHVGPPVGCVEIKLKDVPEMNYLSTKNPPSGEILMRGPCIFSGYYKDPQKTKEDIDSDGWFHTGDIGRWNENGTLSVIDRKKNIIKLSQGEYVATEHLETIYARSPFVKQIFVYGDSYKNYLVGIVVIDEDTCKQWFQHRNEQIPTADEMAKNSNLKNAILNDLNAIGKEHKLNQFELLKGLILTRDEWTPDSGLVTPTLKIKRPQMTSNYKSNIDLLFKEIDVAQPSQTTL